MPVRHGTKNLCFYPLTRKYPTVRVQDQCTSPLVGQFPHWSFSVSLEFYGNNEKTAPPVCKALLWYATVNFQVSHDLMLLMFVERKYRSGQVRRG